MGNLELGLWLCIFLMKAFCRVRYEYLGGRNGDKAALGEGKEAENRTVCSGQVCARVCMCGCTYVCMYVSMCMMYLWIRIEQENGRVCMHVYVYVCVYVRTDRNWKHVHVFRLILTCII